MVEGQDREQASAIAEELSNIAKSEGILRNLLLDMSKP